MQPENLVRQYRAQLFDEKGTITITSVTLEDAQKKVRNVLGSSPRFSQNEESNTQTIYADNHFKGKQPCGWITEMDVPETLSVKPVVEQRMGQQKAA